MAPPSVQRERVTSSVGMAFAVLVVSFTVGCGRAGTEPAEKKSEPGPSAASSIDCEKPSKQVVAAIETGLTVTGGGSLGTAAAVRSPDYDRVWMLAAEVEGPGLRGETGVWAVNDIAEPRTIYSADAVASEFSDWGSGPISPTDRGIDDAAACLKSQ